LQIVYLGQRCLANRINGGMMRMVISVVMEAGVAPHLPMWRVSVSRRCLAIGEFEAAG